MALKAIRFFSTPTILRRILGSKSTLDICPLHTRSQEYSKQDQAFWDTEGSTPVEHKQSNNVKEDCDKKENVLKAVENSDVVRITKFGHIRLDQDNQPRYEKTTESSDSFNFIDEQFFGNKPSSPSPAASVQENPIHKASDVPLDTNIVDQQYFYPSSNSEEKEIPKPTTLSAADLDFKGNEIDQQFFGTRSASAKSKVQKPIGEMSAFSYLKSLHNSKETGSENKPSFTNVGVSRKTSATDEQTTDSTNDSSVSYANMMPNLYKMPNELIVSLLKKSILYNKDGIIALDKPYGLVTTDSDGKSQIVLTNFLPELSKLLGVEKLYTVHRLDRDTTGVLLVASNQDTANTLNKLFLDRQIKKRYIAITKGVPSPSEGVIDIPLCETTMSDRKRMSLRPVMTHSDDSLRSARYNAKGKSHKAITHFQVIRSSGGAAFVELEPETGVRHQLRVHLSQALSCPVLGDHKYSHEDKYAPQKLPQLLLDRLALKQSKTRTIPMHLHAAYVSIPGFGEGGKDLEIYSPLPAFFRYTMKKLKLNNTKKR